MKIRYHEWMTRGINETTFTFAEHCLYAGMALGFGAWILGATYQAFTHPSVATFAFELATLVGAWAVMLQTPPAKVDAKGADKAEQRESTV